MIASNLKNLYVCTPAAPYNPDYLEKALARLKALGFNPTLSKHAMDRMGNVSANIEDRVADLHEGFSNPAYDMIMSSRGGWNSNELLPYLDYELIRKNPKPFMGFSDPSTLVTTLYQKSGTPTYYGTVMSWIYFDPEDADYAPTLDVLADPKAFKGFYKAGHAEQDVYRHGSMSGPMVGGCISILCCMLGTPYAMKVPDGAILFLEDDEEPSGYIWQQRLMQMKQASYFDKISGLVMGKTLPETKFVEGSGLKEILDAVIGEYKFPVLLNADFGHASNPLAIPYGLEYSIQV